MKEGSKFYKDFFAKETKINTYQLKSLTNDFLTYWNESIHPDTELFWEEARKEGIDFERKDPLKFALEKSRFRNVHQGMDARNNWEEVKKLQAILERFSTDEIAKIDRIIAEDENRRLNILKKCRRKKEIPQSQYLKFGECMAYFNNCRLFGLYFSQEEVEELYVIWKNFRSH